MKKKYKNINFWIVPISFLVFGLIIGGFVFPRTEYIGVGEGDNYCYDTEEIRNFATLTEYIPKTVNIGISTYPTTGDCNEPNKYCFITSYKQSTGELHCACWNG